MMRMMMITTSVGGGWLCVEGPIGAEGKVGTDWLATAPIEGYTGVEGIVSVTDVSVSVWYLTSKDHSSHSMKILLTFHVSSS